MIKKIAVIGTGVIGTGWIIRFLAHDKKVIAYDKNLNSDKKIIAEIKRTWPYVKKLFNKKRLKLKNFSFTTSLKESLKDADFIQECAPENYKLKIKLMEIIGKYSKPNIIISSSSSGLLPSKIYSKCKNPSRTVIAHPFNPVYMLPGVEIVPGKKTDRKFLKKANKFKKSVSMNPIMIKKK
jgi:3-hydroxyacyl-CoA dehydrogenase